MNSRRRVNSTVGRLCLNPMAFKHYKYFIDREPLMQFACFECRKSFKRKLGRETYACPQCGKPMCEMGRQFKAPKLDDAKQWRKVEALVRGGITFNSQRLYSLRNMPKVLREVAPFIRRVRTPKMSDGARLLSSTPRTRRKRISA
jgi:DNA-directed RNA polymerase subunit RPC12/RpoP